jgi:hypothetical protein
MNEKTHLRMLTFWWRKRQARNKVLIKEMQIKNHTKIPSHPC